MADTHQIPDEQLIDACRNGDEGAWNALVERYERLVYTVPTRYGLTPAEIDDVFQSVWFIAMSASIWRYLGKRGD